MGVTQGDVYWADFGEPRGSAPAFRRPAVVVQCDEINASRISTVVVVPVTSNLRRAVAPGNVTLPSRTAGLSGASVANVSQITTVDRTQLLNRIGRLTAMQLGSVIAGVDLILGR